MEENQGSSGGSPQSSALTKLDRKRATDRRAQRASRQRRQDYINSLHHQIEALSGLPHSQVSSFFDSNASLKTENEQLRNQIATLLADNPGHVSTDVSVIPPPDESGSDSVVIVSHGPEIQRQMIHNESPCVHHDSPSLNDHHHSDTNLDTQPCSPQFPQLELFEWLPEHVPSTCLPDQIMADFVHDMKRKGLSAKSCSSCPDIWLLFRHRPPRLGICPSVVVIDIISTFPDIVSLTEQVASFLFMFKILNWECHPTRENYNSMPEWLRPIPIQLRVPHPSWMDRIPWPGMRAYLIAHQATLTYDEFSAFYRGALTISWPYPVADILISCPSEVCQEQKRINPVFEHHIMKLEVWSLKDSFWERFPRLKEASSYGNYFDK